MTNLEKEISKGIIGKRLHREADDFFFIIPYELENDLRDIKCEIGGPYYRCKQYVKGIGQNWGLDIPVMITELDKYKKYSWFEQLKDEVIYGLINKIAGKKAKYIFSVMFKENYSEEEIEKSAGYGSMPFCNGIEKDENGSNVGHIGGGHTIA